MSQSIKQAPAVPLRGGVVYPGGTTVITVTRARSLKAARAARQQRTDLLILVQIDPEIDNPTKEDLVPVGILATVQELKNTPQGTQMSVRLRKRIHFQEIVQNSPHLEATYTDIEHMHDAIDSEKMAKAIALVEEYASALGDVNRQLLTRLRSLTTVGQLADFIGGLLTLPLETDIELLQMFDGEKRLETVIEYLEREVQIADIRTHLQQEAHDGAEKAQRDFLLREQMKAIQKELGDDGESVVSEMGEKIAAAEMPEKVQARALKELKRLERQGDMSAESSVIRSYLEWLTELPWNFLTKDNLDIDHVRAVLDEDHYGLNDVKERIVEYVAVRKLAGDKMRGPIINLNGPPGVGKTSIATSVAKAIGREMVRISLGGVRDEAEIRGHRRTYIGAIPGRIVRALRDCGSRNPVIVFDEIDKVGKDWRGDPASALLEVLDPEQNSTFQDHYLELPIDLSQVIFITTSNQISTIPDALRDRMEIIEMEGYIEDQKLAIANEYLIRKQVLAHGLELDDVELGDDAVRHLVRYYTHEAGVRQLEREIGSLIRKAAVKKARGEEPPFEISTETILAQLGPEKFTFGSAEESDEVGVVTGLAVIGYSSDTLSIEIRLSEGKGRLNLTGKLGDVMKESAQAALTYVRTTATQWGLDPVVFDKTDIHIHIPAGATPKDGPSAGIALSTAIVSAFANRPVRKDVAMTGEVTIRGKVLPIGGLVAKLIAAHRSGIKTAIFPEENKKHLRDLPERISEELEFIPVSHMDTVIEYALLDPIGKPFGWGKESQGSLTVPPTVSDKKDRPIQA